MPYLRFCRWQVVFCFAIGAVSEVSRPLRVACPVQILLYPLLRSGPPRSSYSSDVSSARIARAISLVERHLVSRASKSLFQPSLAPLVPSTVEKLRAFHPPAAVAASSLPVLPESSPRIHVDGKVLADLVKGKVANGSSPGPSGWTGELLLALTGDPDCLAGIVALVEDIINGLLDDRARSVLLASTLIATKRR